MLATDHYALKTSGRLRMRGQGLRDLAPRRNFNLSLPVEIHRRYFDASSKLTYACMGMLSENVNSVRVINGWRAFPVSSCEAEPQSCQEIVGRYSTRGQALSYTGQDPFNFFGNSADVVFYISPRTSGKATRKRKRHSAWFPVRDVLVLR